MLKRSYLSTKIGIITTQKNICFQNFRFTSVFLIVNEKPEQALGVLLNYMGTIRGLLLISVFH